jgi:hypothetical protein
MVKTRLLNWNLHKKLHLPELRTALKMLSPERPQWPSQEPQFRIHRRLVGLDDILRSFGRKGILNPFEWTRTTSDEDYEHSSNVELLTVFTPTNSEKELEGASQTSSDSTSTMPHSSIPVAFTSPVADDGRETLLYGYPEVPITVNWPLQDPDIYIHTATAVQQVQLYCSRYMTSVGSLVHQEPDVHHLTCHARFLDRMDEGISLIGRGHTKLAFDKFDNGFELLKSMLMDLHPMAIATFLLLLAKLTINKITPVSAELLRHSHKLANAMSSVPHHLVELLRSISESGELLEMPLLCLHAASDVLEASAAMHWKTLYVKERHCDALYHAQMYGEAATRRAQLLKLQEARYGPSARNVLWTSLNVADDHLIHGQLEGAEERFLQVLQQSEQHSDYHRAKSRVVALEGLAKVALFRASKQLNARLDSAVALQSLDSAFQLLQRALKLVYEALELAQAWFESASRRIKRLLDLRDEVQLNLDSLSL